MDVDERDLSSLLEAAERATGLNRIDYRDPIAAHGVAAIERLEPWLHRPNVGSFALRTIEHAARRGSDEQQAAIDALRRQVAGIRSVNLQREVQAAVTRLRGGTRAATDVAVGAAGATIAGRPKGAGDYIPPLSPGEDSLLRLLGRGLPAGWTIFVRPHLDGDKPAFALLHREMGAMLWDVHESDLGGVTGAPRSYQTQDGTPFLDPLERVNSIRHRLYSDYLPDMAEAVDTQTARFGAIQVGVYFPNATNERVRSLGMFGRAEIAVTSEGLHARDLRDLVPNTWGKTVFEDRWYEALFGRFSEYHPPTMSRVVLTKVQRDRIEDPLESVWRGIEGVAGSGKSTVLARRATRLAGLGRRVLLVTYNVTLANYCRALAEDAPDGYFRELLVVQHFHGLCHVILRRLDLPPPLHPEGRDESADGLVRNPADVAEAVNVHFELAWPERVLDVLGRYQIPADLRFDAILVDEAQDFSPPFMAVLEKLRFPDTEVVLAFDRAQRLYGREDGITGRLGNRVRKLTGTHRLRQRHAEIATSVGIARGLPTEPIVLDDDRPTLFADQDAMWAAVPTRASALAVVVDVLERWRAGDTYRPDGSAVLVPSAAIGKAVVELLAQRDIATNHIFGLDATDRKGRRSKVSFVPHDQRVKVATIHSYKGWEADDVIVVEPPFGGERMASAVYVALTRPRSRLMVVATSDDYGIQSMFDDYVISPDEGLIRQAQRVLGRHAPYERDAWAGLPTWRSDVDVTVG